MRIYGLVPARSGSKGLPDKNIKPIAGHPLFAYSISFGQALGLERVIVSTDSPRYAEIAKAYGADCPVLRGAAASSDTAMEYDILEDLDRTFGPAGIPLPDLWVVLRPVTPFRDLEHTRTAIARMVEDPTIDSVQFVVSADPRMHAIGPDGRLIRSAVGWDHSRSKMRRGEFPKLYNTYGTEICRHEMWREHRRWYLGRALAVPSHAITGQDVDDLDDFEIVRSLIEATPQSDVVARHTYMPRRV
jgi:CMP-N,N'-diacetyllegionaminic acid synthase